jgi:glycosyltransferase involved in cell wall biosynthesis
MRIFIEYWRDHGPGSVRAIVTQEFLDTFGYVFAGFDNRRGSRVRWAVIDAEDEAIILGAREFSNNFTRADSTFAPLFACSAAFLSSLLDKYCKRFPTRHVLLMNLQENILSLGAQIRAPTSLSGIVFLPGFFYLAEMAADSLRARAYYALQNRVVRTRLLTHPDMRVLFFLDQAVVAGLNELGTAKAVYLPDPVHLPQRPLTATEASDTRRRFGVPADRKLFLLFGDLRPRKGLWKLFAALAGLSAEECSRISVAIVGHAETQIEDRIGAETARLSGKQISVVRRMGYVSDAERDAWFDIADVVIAPYIRHLGSSGVLLLAAANRKPVISQDFGLMGRLTREHCLGVAVDTRDPKALAQAMRNFLGAAAPAEFDPEAAYAFAQSQSAERFGAVLIEALRPFMT